MFGVHSKASSHSRTLLLCLCISGPRDLTVILETACLQVCHEIFAEIFSDLLF